jgi:murein DD-endopeptidase MepM/ murein hydrolase activator NlpD
MSRFILPFSDDFALVPVNETLHGLSRYRREFVPHHNVVMGNSVPGTGDAIDLFVEPDRAVFAFGSCRVVERRKLRTAGWLIVCEGIALKRQFLACYCHLRLEGLAKFGAVLQPGQIVGHICGDLEQPHLHLEVWQNGVALAAKEPTQLRQMIMFLGAQPDLLS